MTTDPEEFERESSGKSREAFRTISEVAEELGLPQHVLRFWETRFPQIKPIKRGGGRRYYRPNDVDLLRGVKELLYGEGYTIRGVQRILREQGGRRLATNAGAAATARAEEAGEERAEPRLEGQATGLDGAPAGPEIWAPRGRRATPLNDPAPASSSYVDHDGADPQNAERHEAASAQRTAAPVARLSDDQARRLGSALSELAAAKRLLESR